MTFLIAVKSLSIVDWAQIGIAVGTLFAALFAIITTIQNRTANKQLQLERHMLVKPIFTIRTTFEKRVEKHITLDVVNIGYTKIKNAIGGSWSGTSGIKVDVKKLLTYNPDPQI